MRRKKKSNILLIALIFMILAASFLFINSNREEGKRVFFTKEIGQETNELIKAAKKLLNTFNNDQLKRIIFEFSDSERFNWNYVPTGREGIPIKEFNDNQHKLFKDLLNASLSQRGVDKAEGVIILENVLFELSGGSSFRDPGLYYITFFGPLDKDKPWGWRFEGHHLSLNFTILKDSILVSTPMFFGANPGEVKEGKHNGLRVLKFEEDYARELIKSLDEEQFKIALIEEDAPGDIITGNDERIEPLNPKGISASKLKKEQSEILLELIKVYIANSNPEKADQRTLDLEKSKIDEIFFAWAGGIEKGQPHYYRIQSKTFLIEYDNTQNNANHIHSVWRSFQNDFGNDLLKKHYEEYPH